MLPSLPTINLNIVSQPPSNASERKSSTTWTKQHESNNSAKAPRSLPLKHTGRIGTLARQLGSTLRKWSKEGHLTRLSKESQTDRSPIQICIRSQSSELDLRTRSYESHLGPDLRFDLDVCPFPKHPSLQLPPFPTPSFDSPLTSHSTP